MKIAKNGVKVVKRFLSDEVRETVVLRRELQHQFRRKECQCRNEQPVNRTRRNLWHLFIDHNVTSSSGLLLTMTLEIVHYWKIKNFGYPVAKLVFVTIKGIVYFESEYFTEHVTIGFTTVCSQVTHLFMSPRSWLLSSQIDITLPLTESLDVSASSCAAATLTALTCKYIATIDSTTGWGRFIPVCLT